MDQNHALTINAFGGFSIKAGKEKIDGFDRIRLQELLIFLLLNRGQILMRSQIAFLFWPESNESQALSNFRNLFYYLRQDLPEYNKFIASDSLTITWHQDASVWFDVAEFEENLAAAGRTMPWVKKVGHLENAINLYVGELLPAIYNNWLLLERKRLTRAYGVALSELISLYKSRRQYQHAIQHTRSLIQHDPLREPAYAELMRLQALSNNRAAALHTYHSCVTLFRKEMGVEPGRALRALYEQLLKDEKIPKTKSQAKRAVPLVGRDKTWKIFKNAWHRAIQDPHLVQIHGEAGIGKTHLAEAFCDWVASKGGTVLKARCYATETSLAYAPIISWLRSNPLEDIDPSFLIELSQFLPEIHVLQPNLPEPKPINGDCERLHLFEALEDAFLTGRKSLLLFLDDIQWCDPETIDWLSYILSTYHHQSESPQLLVVTALRSDSLDTNPSLIALQSELARNDQLTLLELNRLNSTETLDLSKFISGNVIDSKLGPTLYKITEGHPFFIVGLIRAAMPLSKDYAKQMVALTANLPDKVQLILETRLAQLSPLAREVVEQAAVIGRSFTYPVLSHLTNLSENDLVGCLDECWQSHVIREQGNNAYDFSHNKLREVAYGGISLTRRRWLHRQLAKTLELLHSDELECFADVIAGHYEKAGFIELAISYYIMASQAASRIYAHDKALAALEMVLKLLQVLEPKGIYQNLLAEYHEKIGDIRALTAQHQAACKDYQAALTYIPNKQTLSQARLARKIGNLRKQERGGYDVINEHYQEAADLLGQPNAERNQAWWEAWCALQLDQLELRYSWQQPDFMKDQIYHIRTKIEQYGTRVQKATLYRHLMYFKILENRFIAPAGAVDYARDALEVLPKSAGPHLVAACEFAHGFSLLWHGDIPEAITSLHKALGLTEHYGDIILQARCLAYLVVAHRLIGNQIEVEKYAQYCLTISKRAELVECIGVSQAGLSWAALRSTDQINSSHSSLPETKHLSQQAMAAWNESKPPYPIQWQALWPLIHVAMARGQIVEAIYYANKLCAPTQQALDPELEEPLTSALTAWNKGSRLKTMELLNQSLKIAQNINFA